MKPKYYGPVKKQIERFNKPHSMAVAINCSGIGDDNDYSCFLAQCIYELWAAGHSELARGLANTDPMMNDYLSPQDFEEMMQHRKKFQEEQKEREAHSWKVYAKD